jgi:hypothetical protein
MQLSLLLLKKNCIPSSPLARYVAPFIRHPHRSFPVPFVHRSFMGLAQFIFSPSPSKRSSNNRIASRFSPLPLSGRNRNLRIRLLLPLYQKFWALRLEIVYGCSVGSTSPWSTRKTQSGPPRMRLPRALSLLAYVICTCMCTE